MKNIKLHLVYLSIIAFLIIALCITNVPNLLRWYFYRDGTTYLKIHQDVEISNPANGNIIGKLYSGAVLHGPLIEDLDDTDIGDNDRWKILVDADIVKNENRELIDSENRDQLTVPFSYELKDTEQKH